jgi:uncharacterized membrane protein YjfL (UPF0719 family)
LSTFEILVLIISILLAFKGWVTWYSDIVSVNRLTASFPQRFLLSMAPVLSALLIAGTLAKLAASTVRADFLYIGFYLVIGAGWLGGVTLVIPFLGVSARDDVLERGNSAASWTLAGALLGASCAFAGANIGNGPGVEAALFSAALSSALFILLWVGTDALTSISEAITVERDTGAGIRLGGFLLGVGIVSGWAVAGDWVSAAATLKDFFSWSWPAIVLAAFAVLVETVLAKNPRKDSSSVGLSAILGLTYVAVASVWVIARGVHS